MTLKIRHLIVIALTCIVSFSCWSTYWYFFDTVNPTITIEGITHDAYHAGEIACTAMTNKSGTVVVLLDGKPVSNKFRISAQEECPFTIPTKSLTPGKHLLFIEFNDNTYHKNKTSVEKSFLVDNVPLQAALISSENDCKVLQGRTLHLQVQSNKEVRTAYVELLSQKYPCFAESKGSLIYECFIPITCEEQPNEYLMSIHLTDKVNNIVTLQHKFQVIAYPFKNVTMTISPEKVKEEEALGPDLQRFEEEIADITRQSPQEKLWRGSFCKPIDIIQITGEFGTIRTTQHRGRYAHKAVDVINAPRSVIWAPQDGMVVMKKRFALSGNTVAIDHGCGIVSLFFHLDDFAKINLGDKITKGSPLGYIGKTGYAKGYHLHWEMRINNIQVDPLQWTKPGF